MEVWRDIAGYEGWYAISNYGNVRRERTGGATYVGRVLKPCFSGTKYGYVSLFKSGNEFKQRVHQLVALHFIGPVPEGKQVNHKDGNKQNNQSDNLEYLSTAENLKHARDLGLRDHCRGEQHYCAKLSPDAIKTIRAKYAQGVSRTQLSLDYGVSKTNIAAIVLRKTWRHL